MAPRLHHTGKKKLYTIYNQTKTGAKSMAAGDERIIQKVKIYTITSRSPLYSSISDNSK
jgi:hypothetical protein